MPNNLLITNCLVSGNSKPCDIIIERGIITQLGKGLKVPSGYDRFDAGSSIVSPGFIDVHVQGAGGADILDSREEALHTISQTCARYGVTGFLATTVYKPGRENLHLRVAARNTGTDLGGAQLLGIHLEGPFISSKKRGMIQPDSISPPSMSELERILELTGGTLRIMTIAPELKGIERLIARLREQGIVASFGHSNATYEQTLAGFEAGISHVTHLFNAMPTMHHREPGALPALFECNISAQVIPDGVHIHPAVLRLACQLLGPERTVAITDGMQAMGLPDGEYEYNGLRYRSVDGTARYGDGTLIGTALGMSELLRRLQDFSHFTFDQTLRTATINPARVIGIRGHGASIEQGTSGNLVILDKFFSVHATIVSGKVVYQR